MAKQTWKAGNMLYPLPAVMVSVTDGKGQDDIITQSTELLFYGEGSREMAENAFKMEPENDAFYLEGVVSRKKQLIPPLMEAAQMSGDYA